MKEKLFNPFLFVAGTKALLIGLGVMILTAVIGFASHSHFNGVIDFHKFSNNYSQFIAEQGIIWGCAVLVFFCAGLLFSKSSIRFIDVAGTMALSRWPMIFTAILGFGIKSGISRVEDITASTIAFGFGALLFVIWLVALMYNAFSVSCNLKGAKCTIIFIVSLLLAEFVSHLLCDQLYVLVK